MKNANKIINTFYNTKTKEDQKIKIVETKIFKKKSQKILGKKI